MAIKIKILGSSYYDASSLIQFVNILIGIITPIVYYNTGVTRFINFSTIMLTEAIVILNILMLAYEKRSRDPFIQLMIFVTTMFYLTRVLTLLYDPIPFFASALFRYKLAAKDVNYTMVIIALSNIALFLGFVVGKGKTEFRKIDFSEVKPGNPINVTLILLLTFFCNFFFILGIESIGRISTFIAGIFLSTGIMLLMALVYTVLNYKQLSWFFRIVMLSMFLIFLVIATIFGSRSSFLTLAVLIFCVILAYKNELKISRRLLITGILLIPVLVLSFVVATYLRRLQYDTKTVINKERIDYLSDFKLSKVKINDNGVLSPIFDRMGYLGYATDMISNGDKYRKVINFPYYFKSVVDNGITPGFNIFNTPKASHSLRYIYSNLKANPTHQDIIKNYNSDLFTVYGEYYILFHGFPAFIILFFAAFLFKRFYLSVKTTNTYLFYLYRALILLVFYNWLTSYGFDWMIIELISYLVPVFIWWKWFTMRKREKPDEEIVPTFSEKPSVA